MRKKVGRKKPLIHRNELFQLQFIFRPGLTLPAGECRRLVHALREVASTCFDDMPDYQVLRGTSDELNDKVLAVAWRPDGKAAGFCSCVLLQVPGLGEVLHLGLTCVRPDNRHCGLTHKLTKKAVSGYMVRYRPIGRVWISNCAAVLSSLGNVAMHFDNVFPSPFAKKRPSKHHLKIAAAIDRYYRDKMYVNDDAVFDPIHFVFRGSVQGTVFEKEGDDARFHHRQSFLNKYYQGIMKFENGDEILQIGYASSLTAFKYKLRNRKRKKIMLVPEMEPITNQISA